MRILRIEYDGGGMYRGASGRNAWVESGCCTEDGEYVDQQAHPLPREDSLLNQQPWEELCQDWWGASGRFGFSDLAQLRRWLYQDDWVARLSDFGCELVEYETCGACYVGHTQVVFDINEAVEVTRRPLSCLLEQTQ